MKRHPITVGDLKLGDLFNWGHPDEKIWEITKLNGDPNYHTCRLINGEYEECYVGGYSSDMKMYLVELEPKDKLEIL